MALLGGFLLEFVLISQLASLPFANHAEDSPTVARPQGRYGGQVIAAISRLTLPGAEGTVTPHRRCRLRRAR